MTNRAVYASLLYGYLLDWKKGGLVPSRYSGIGFGCDSRNVYFCKPEEKLHELFAIIHTALGTGV